MNENEKNYFFVFCISALSVCRSSVPFEIFALKKVNKMPRTRKSALISQENIIQPDEEVKKPRRRLRKRKSSEESEDSSPNKQSPKRNDSLSPTISNKLNEQLKLTTPKSSNKFTSARQALADNSNLKLPGREAQFDELTSFLNENIDNKASCSLYINGPPGKFLFKLLI